MSEGFCNVPLARIATPIFRPVTVSVGTLYRTMGVKWWGEGAYERETIDGSQTAAKTLSLVCEGDLIINKIWVRHGSTAVATKAVDGCAASGEFPTFALDLARVEPRWLHWQTKTQSFWAKCEALSQGTSGKNRIKPELFLTIQVPLPPLPEQRRIVVRIDELAAKIEEAKGLRRKAVEEADVLFSSAMSVLFDTEIRQSETKRLEVLADKIADINHSMPQAVATGKKLVSPKDFSKTGIDFRFCKQISKDDFDTLRTKIQPQRGDILFSRIGTIGQARLVEVDEEFIASYSIVTIRPNREHCIPKYLLFALQSPSTLSQAVGGVRGIAMPDLGIKHIRTFTIPCPCIAKQERIVAYLDGLQAKVDALKALQGETAAELNALLPSVLDRAFSGRL